MGNKRLTISLFLAIFWLSTASGCSRPVERADSPILPTEQQPTATLSSPTPTGTATPVPSPIPTNTATPSGKVTLIAVGDLMLGRSVGEQILEKGPQVVFEQVQSTLEKADLRVGNLECALTDIGTPAQKTFTLKAPPEAAEALSAGGFDLVSLANNHAMDYGAAGLQRSHAILLSAGIASVGAGQNFALAHTPVILQKNGLKIAFLGYVDVPEERDGFDARTWIATETQPGLAWADPAQIAKDVAAAKNKADVVVVLLHSGNEITPTYLSVITSGQMEEARAAIDAGAALVIGSHPHELQTIERYHGGLIAYSLGNFVFDDYLGIANASIILQVSLDRNGFVDYSYVPVLIENGLPHVITPDLAPGIGTLVAP